ncbi:MAG: phage holin family protein [Chitinophagaceae bacterium]
MKLLKFENNTMIQIFNIKTPMLLLAGISFTWFTVEYVPSAMLFFYLLVAMFGDFVTGLLKSWKKGEVTSSEGLRRSITKVLSYGGAILVIMTLVNVVGLVDTTNSYDLAIVINGLMGFIVFVELYSICENINQAYPNTPLTIYFIAPVMKFLRGRFEKAQTQVNE